MCAVEHGADALGFNLFQGSPRRVSLKRLETFLPDLPSSIKKVAIFVDEEEETVKKVLGRLSFDILQFHGDEPADYCDRFGLPYIKALRATSSSDITQSAARYPDAAYLLLDTDGDGQFGGSGRMFDWHIIPALGRQIILAGGLTPDNVTTAIEVAKPYGVDVSSGVEKEKGKKDHTKVAAFIEAVRRADQEAA